MNESTKNTLIASATALVVALAVSGAIFFSRSTVSQPNAAVQPLATFSVQPSASQAQEPSLGGFIHNTQESFDQGIAVNGTSFIDGSRNVTGTNLYVSGLSTGNVGGKIVSTMSSSATTTACAILNSSGQTRVIDSTNVVDTGTAASLGTVTWIIGTSTASGVAPTAAINRAVDTTITRLNGRDVLTTTSTAQTVSFPWRDGEYLVFISSTTTNAGRCRVLY